MKSQLLLGTVLMLSATTASAKTVNGVKKKHAHLVHVSATKTTRVAAVDSKELRNRVDEAMRLRQAATHAEPVIDTEEPIVAISRPVATAKENVKEAGAKESAKELKELPLAEAALAPAAGSKEINHEPSLGETLKALPPALARVAATTKEVVPAAAVAPKCVTRYTVAFGANTDALPINVCGDKLGKTTQKLLRAARTEGHAFEPALALRIAKLLPAEGNKIVRFDVLADSKGEREKGSHTEGRAVDLKPNGVSLKTLADACKKLDDTGCGAYPEGGFLHIDLRDAGAGNVSWVDAARPGEAPKYVAEWPKSH